MRKFYLLLLTTLFIQFSVSAEKILVVGVDAGNADYDKFMVEIQKIADAVAELDGITSEIKDADEVTSGTFDFSGYDGIVISEASGSGTISKIGTYTDDVVKSIPVVNLKMYAIHDGKGGWNWCPQADFFVTENTIWDMTKVPEQAVMKIIAAHDIFGGYYNVNDEVVLFENVWKEGAHFQGCTFENSAVDDIKNNSTALGTSIVIEETNSEKPAYMLHAIEETSSSKRNVIWGVHSQFSEATDDYYFIVKNALLWALGKETVKVGVDKVNHHASVKLYPNPANDQVHVQFYNSSNGMVKISLYDITGKMVMETYKNMPAGNMQETLNLGSFQSGMYMLRINSVNENFSYKFSLK